MSDYIDRAALGIGSCNRDVFENKSYADGWNAAVKILKAAPTADVSEVVRCKDCKYYDKETGFCLNHSYFKDSDGMSCSPADSRDFTFFNEDDFCSYGKMKDGDKE